MGYPWGNTLCTILPGQSSKACCDIQRFNAFDMIAVGQAVMWTSAPITMRLSARDAITLRRASPDWGTPYPRKSDGKLRPSFTYALEPRWYSVESIKVFIKKFYNVLTPKYPLQDVPRGQELPRADLKEGLRLHLDYAQEECQPPKRDRGAQNSERPPRGQILLYILSFC